MKKLIYIFVLITVISCLNVKQRAVYIFKTPQRLSKLKLLIDGKEIALDTVEKKTDYKSVPAKMIASYFTNKNIIKINLSIEGIDTTFFYQTSNRDSLVVGIAESKRKLFVFKNRQYLWMYD